jgi:hypothetical protein
MSKRVRNQIVVIADPMADDTDRYRHCYWPDALSKKAPRVYAITDYPSARKLYRKTKLLIINWDTANGDPAFTSDITLQYLETQARVRIHELLDAGGTVLAECQTAQGVPVQKSYDAIFGNGEIVVTTHVPPEQERRGETATIARQYADHPLLVGMPKRLQQSYRSTGERLFYDRFATPQQNAQRAETNENSGYIFDRHKSLWFGWFTWWDRGWIPLLFAELPHSYLRKNGWQAEPAPVLLAKVERNGLLLASTLWMSGARCDRLIENVTDVEIDEVRTCHKAILRSRTIRDLIVGFVLAASLVGILRLLVEAAIHPDSFSLAWLISVGGVGSVSFGLAAWNWYVTCVWRRPLGVGIVTSTRRRLSRTMRNGW